ncbi:MAG TPA: HAMP domain-containing sensor histidine kinase [Planctomycetota bacterium]|nr:HAMP domain-containing sensor histidine kinase [Planctomycetota bacterium]
MANDLLYTRLVVSKSLSWQLAVVMLLVALVPLAAAGYLTLDLLERSARDQVAVHQVQIAQAGAAMVRHYIREGQTRLKLIATRLPQGKDPDEIGRQLDRQMDPPGIFLEIGLIDVQGKPEVLAQSQQRDYTTVLTTNNPGNRSFSPRLNQQVTQWDNRMANIDVPLRGGEFIADILEIVKDVPALPISVPGPEKRVLTGNLDFRPVSTLLSSIAGSEQVSLLDGAGNQVGPATRGTPDPGRRRRLLITRTPVGVGSLTIAVSEEEDLAFAPFHDARRRATVWFGLAAVLALGLATLVSRRVVRPVETLSRAAHELAAGNLAARSGIEREDEIGQLAKAFDHMAAAVQQLDRLKGDFVAHVSHELRTPLTSAKVTLANVQEGIGGKESLTRVQDDLDRLIRMVNELLDIARIEAGLQLAKQETNLGDLVQSAAESLRPLAKVALDVSGRGDVIELDPARVQQIVLNLVDNAIKYAKSRVHVETKGREVRVTDDGPGVPAGDRERIFEKFSRVETGPKPPGAGLGLSIARKLAQLHGATLTCEGHTFVLRF